MTQLPSIGRIVQYKLTANDVDRINQHRIDAQRRMAYIQSDKPGYQVHLGNRVSEGDVFPMLITRVCGSGDLVTPQTAVNGQVMLDGNDTLWVSSAANGEEAGQYVWPTRV